MCNLSEVVEESGIQKGLQKGLQEGRQEGRQEERLFVLKTLMRNMKMPVEQALATLEIPERDWPEYRRPLAE